MPRKRLGNSAPKARRQSWFSWLTSPRSNTAHSTLFLGRRLAFESLECRTVLSLSPGASILGTTYNDLTGNGFSGDDALIADVTIALYRDGGNGVFGGAAPESDDTLLATRQTDGLGKYRFDGLAADTYFVQETTPAGYLVESPSNAVTKVVVSSADAQGVLGPSIDSFTTNQLVDATSLGATTAASSIAAPEAIGGHRDLFVQLTMPVGSINLNANAFGQHLLEYNSSATATGLRIVRWDGDNSAAPQTLNPLGLNHADLTGGGAVSGLAIEIGADHDNGQLTFRVYKDANNWSTISVPIPNSGGHASQTVYLPFANFTTGGGSGAGDFSDVGAIEMQIGGIVAVNGQVGMIGALGPKQLLNNIGFYQGARVGDFVFWDLNKSGIQSGSNPAAGVTVQLWHDGAVVATTNTDAQGGYHFSNLAPGAYSLKFIPPAGTLLTLATQGGNAALDSDPNPATGVTPGFTLNSGQVDNTHDAGLLPIDLAVTKSVNNSTPDVGSNVVFTVTLSNGAGYSNATGVTLSDVLPNGLAYVSASPAAGTTFDAGTGVWTVGNLASGASTTLAITAEVTSGGTKTNTVLVTAANEPDVGTQHQASASVTPASGVGDFVFWDTDLTGVQTDTVPGAEGVTVQLLQDDAVVTTTTTNAMGGYQFAHVAPGTYSLKFVPPNGARFTLAEQGDDSALDSDVDPDTGVTASFTLISGEFDNTHDAGLLPIELSVTKTVDNPNPKIGTNVVFTMTVSNTEGFSDATGVLLGDLLPAGLTFVSATAPPGTTFNAGSGVWMVGNLASGDSTTLTITATAATPGLKTNTITVTDANEPNVGVDLEASADVLPLPPITGELPPLVGAPPQRLSKALFLGR